MAEIKSTLDLVMERTKHLTMSSEERVGQQQKDFEKKLQGVLQQYADKVLAIDELMERVTGLQADFKIDDPIAFFAEGLYYLSKFAVYRSTNPVEKGMIG